MRSYNYKLYLISFISNIFNIFVLIVGVVALHKIYNQNKINRDIKVSNRINSYINTDGKRMHISKLIDDDSYILIGDRYLGDDVEIKSLSFSNDDSTKITLSHNEIDISYTHEDEDRVKGLNKIVSIVDNLKGKNDSREAKIHRITLSCGNYYVDLLPYHDIFKSENAVYEIQSESNYSKVKFKFTEYMEPYNLSSVYINKMIRYFNNSKNNLEIKIYGNDIYIFTMNKLDGIN